MKKNQDPSVDAVPSADSTGSPQAARDLRRHAEERLSAKQKSQRSETGDQRTTEDPARLVHELQVHQIELEMQNKELQKARATADALLAQYTDLYDFAPAGYLTLDREGTIRQVNLTGVLLFGVERSRLVKRRLGLFVAESDRRAFGDFLQRVFANPTKECCEVTLPREGSPPIVVQIEGMRSEDGQECRAVVLDITERKQGEALLQERESKLKTLFELLPVGVSITDAQRKISFSNSALERILEISKEGLLRGDYKSRTYLRTDGTPMPAEEFASERAMAEQKAVHDVETGVVKEDGTVIWTSVSAVPTAFPDWKAVIVTADITERKQAEVLERAVYSIARAAETAKSLDDLYQSVHLIIKGLMPAANFYVALYDDKEDLLTFPYYVDEIDPAPPSRRPSNGLTEYVLRTGSTLLCDAALEKELLRRGEAKRFGSPSSCWLAVPLKAGNSTFGVIALDNYSDPKAYGEREKQILEYVSGQVANAIVRKQAEEILRRTEENFRRSLDDSPLGVRIISAEGETLYANRAMLNIYGYDSVEELRLTPIQKRYTPESYAEFKVRHKQRRREKPYLSEYEVNIVRKSGEVRNLYVLRKEIIWNGEIQYQAVYQDITDRKLAEDKLQKTIIELEKAFGGIIQVLSAAVEKRDPYTAGHERRVAALARAIGLEIGLGKDRLNALGMAGSIHDVGKISIPAEILSKPGQLAPFEYKLIQAHPQAGHDILKEIDFPWPIADIILQHHERMNGSGYPAGLKGDDILLEARILAVSDVMEAMASHRPYRPALGIDAAMKEIEENRGILYDSDVTAACLTLFQQKGFSFEEIRSDSIERQAAFLLFAEDRG